MAEVPTLRAAAQLAEALLAPLGDRWTHTQAVASRAEELAVAVPPHEREILVVAAWWHDLGYAPLLIKTGMHQIDGALFLQGMGYSRRLAALVAHHSAAEFEAEQRGLVGELQRWKREESAVADALWTADMTTGPRGERLEYQTRLAEIVTRYDPESIVGRAMAAAKPSVSTAIRRTQDRLEATLP